MDFRFRKHYTREEAESLLPQIREWLKQSHNFRLRLTEMDNRLKSLLDAGHDVGGDVVNKRVRVLADFRRVLLEFQTREIQIKDLERGLIDFPALIGGREVFLCWEQDEDAIEYWHELDTGYAGREKL